MIEIHTSVPHQLGQAAAVERMQDMVATLSQQYPQQVHQVQLHLRDQRIEVRFAAYGYVVEWVAEVQADRVDLHGLIPESAKPFRNKIEQAIMARVEANLASVALRAAA